MIHRTGPAPVLCLNHAKPGMIPMTDQFSSNGHSSGDEADSISESLRLGMQILHGEEIAIFEHDEFSGGGINILPDIALTVTGAELPGTLEAVTPFLARFYPPGHTVLLQPEGQPAQIYSLAELPLASPDPGVPANLVVPPLPKLDAARSPFTLQYIVARLRDENGCPWDREQSHATLRDSILNEAYEVTDAIDNEDWENLAEELGDLFLLVAMHAQIAEEAGEFTLEDVYEGITTKIIRRHPHVFGDVEADDAEKVLANWNEIKKQEKAGKPPKREKAKDGLPRSMPALTRAARILKERPFAAKPGQTGPGDDLLALISAMVHDGHDPETVLQQALDRHLD